MKCAQRNMSKLVIIVLLFFIILIIVCPFVLDGISSQECTFEGLKNNCLNGFWGSYIGGALGGVGTLFAVLLNLIQQEEHDKYIKNKEREQFISGIEELIARYSTDISKYQYQFFNQQQQRNITGTIVPRPDQSVALECRTMLTLRLADIDKAKDLLQQLEIVQKKSIQPIQPRCFEEELEKLHNMVVRFKEQFINC